jgi:hypothetical protein
MSNPIQNKLLNYEVQPPEDVWDKIAASFEDVSHSLAEKLFQYEEAPSAAVWKNIEGQLNEAERKPISIFSRQRKLFRYSGAAAAFIVIAISVSLLISKKTESELSAAGITSNKTTTKDTTKKTDQKQDEAESNSVSQTTIDKDTQLLTASKTKTTHSKKNETEGTLSMRDNYLPEKAQKAYVSNSSFTSDKYMIYSDGEGNAVRLPKKIFNAFACPTGNADCKQRLQMLREKFAESAVTADFTGLLEILKSLQENQ